MVCTAIGPLVSPWPKPWHSAHNLGRETFGQVLIDRAVRVVTVQAIFPNRRMFEQERSALLGVTFVASVIDGGFFPQAFGGRAVRLMAICAGHLAFAQRHV